MQTLLDWDQVWARVSQLADFRNMSQAKFRPAAIGQQFALAAAAVGTAAVQFPVGSVILGITAGLSVSAAATAEIRGLNCLRVGLDYSGSQGSIITGGRMNAAALFGNVGNRSFPGRELVIPRGDILNLGVENLSTSTISVDFVFHSMVPNQEN